MLCVHSRLSIIMILWSGLYAVARCCYDYLWLCIVVFLSWLWQLASTLSPAEACGSYTFNPNQNNMQTAVADPSWSMVHGPWDACVWVCIWSLMKTVVHKSHRGRSKPRHSSRLAPESRHQTEMRCHALSCHATCVHGCSYNTAMRSTSVLHSYGCTAFIKCAFHLNSHYIHRGHQSNHYFQC